MPPSAAWAAAAAGEQADPSQFGPHLPSKTAPQERKKPQVYLDGWAGSGKSVALYSLVAWARQHGWLALYIPSAFSLVQSECWLAVCC